MSIIVCTKCNKKMSHVRSGVHVLETYEDGVKPYKVWSADRYACETCDTELVAGFGTIPLKMEYEEDFQQWVRSCEFNFR